MLMKAAVVHRPLPPCCEPSGRDTSPAMPSATVARSRCSQLVQAGVARNAATVASAAGTLAAPAGRRPVGSTGTDGGGAGKGATGGTTGAASSANKASRAAMVLGPTTPSEGSIPWAILNAVTAAAVSSPYVASAPKTGSWNPRSSKACCTLRTASPDSGASIRWVPSRQACRTGSPVNRAETSIAHSHGCSQGPTKEISWQEASAIARKRPPEGPGTVSRKAGIVNPTSWRKTMTGAHCWRCPVIVPPAKNPWHPRPGSAIHARSEQLS